MKTCFVVWYILVAVELTNAFLPLRSDTRSLFQFKSDRGCLFGDKLHKLGSSWQPDLGKPFGVMYCIRCDCVKVMNKDGREENKITCHDVRKDCPPVKCKGAQVQRGECCPSCPDDKDIEVEDGTEEKWDVHERNSRFASVLNDEDSGIYPKTLKEYFAILIGPEHQERKFIARSSFSVYRGNLHFTVQNYEHVWKNLPKNVLRLLDDGMLSLKITLSTANVLAQNVTLNDGNSYSEASIAKDTASGRIKTHRALSAETFSSILINSRNDKDSTNGGAIAMITLGRNFKNIDFAVVFRNITLDNGRKRRSEQPIHVKLELRNGDDDVLRKTERKIANKKNELADAWNANSDILRALGRGSLRLVLEARIGRRGPVARYIGNITTKASCDLIQAVISGNNCNPPKSTGSVGSVIIRINQDNSVSYEVSVSGMTSEVKSVQFRAFYRKRMRVIMDITAQLQEGKAVGLMKEISARELHLLQNGDSWITVSTESNPVCEIQGHVATLLYSGHFARYTGMPIPLSGSLVFPPVHTGAGGHAWLQLDEKCHLHYEIVVSGLNKDVDDSVAAHLHGLAEISGMELTHKKLLKGFYGTEARGILSEIPIELYRLMNDGMAFLQVVTKRNPSGEIRGKIRILNSCDVSQLDSTKNLNNTQTITEDDDKLLPGFRVPSKERVILSPNSCHFEGAWYRHKEEWSPAFDRLCSTCKCEHEKVICKPVSCSPTPCPRPVIIETECCPVCEDSLSAFMGKPEDDSYSIGSLFQLSNIHNPSNGYSLETSQMQISHQKPEGGCYQNGDPVLHPRGSTWSPYVPPFGRVSCLSCTCDNNDKHACGKVKCSPTPCPFPKRKKPSDCCRVCSDHSASVTVQARPTIPNTDWLQDGNSKVMCSFGKELYAVGSSWKPSAHRIGKIECITCTCEEDSQHGVKVKCARKCPSIPNDCVDVVRNIRDCCPKCGKRKQEKES